MLGASIAIILISTVVLISRPIVNDVKDKPDTFGTYAEWVSVYVEAASAGFFAYTVWLMIIGNRTTTEELRYDMYQQLRDHHHDLLRLQMEWEKSLLLDVYLNVPKPSDAAHDNESFKEGNPAELKSEKEREIFNFYVAEFDLYERVYEVKKDGVIDEEEWLTWLLYLEKISHHWLFRFCYNSTRMVFDEELMKEITDKIIDPENPKQHIEDLISDLHKEEDNDKKEKDWIPKRVDII